MILEAVVTTVSSDGNLNIAPMGPEFDPELDHFELRPYETSTTYQNLIGTGCGVLHVTDDVLLIARTAINCLDDVPATISAQKVNGRVLADCCRWYEFTATKKPANAPRRIFHCQVVESSRKRDFFGFNRAKHAVLEATIAATRIDFVPLAEIQDQLNRARLIVDKTGGQDEIAACQLLEEFVNQKTAI